MKELTDMYFGGSMTGVSCYISYQDSDGTYAPLLEINAWGRLIPRLGIK